MPTDSSKLDDAKAAASESGFSIVNSLSILICGGYAVAMPLWMWWPTEAKPEVLAIINQMMGAWQMAFATVIAFHFGSSNNAKVAGAANRDALASVTATVAKTADTAATAATAAATAASAATGAAPPLVNGAVETGTWNDAIAANTAEAFDAYLAKFPTGVHAAEARSRAAALRAS